MAPKFRKLRSSTASTSPGNGTRNNASNQSGSNSGRVAESVGTSRPNASGAQIEPNDLTRPGSPASESDDESIGQVVRKVRGPSRGLKLEKHVKEFGKMVIAFKPGEKKPMKYESQFATGIGVSIRTWKELDGVSLWKDVSEETKLILLESIEQWFIIEDLDTDRVDNLLDYHFQESYRQWRYTLGACYKKLEHEKKNPRAGCPRLEVTTNKWLGVCDRVESTAFKAEPSEIELWRINHVDKNGQFVNDKAKKKYDIMIDLKETYAGDEKVPMTKAEILEVVLGHRSGYKKGMGHGVEGPRKTKRFRTQETESATEKISSLTMELDQQKEENNINKEQIANLTAENDTNKAQIVSLMEQVARFNEFMGRFPDINNQS